MRLTLDVDEESLFSLFLKIFRGLILTRKLPEEVNKTRKGFHVIFYGLRTTERKILSWRLFCGDDKRRVFLDCNPKRFKSVLFDHKVCFVFRDGKPQRLLYCFACHKPLISFFLFDYSSKRFFCSKECMNKPYKYEAKTRQVFRLLKRLGIKTGRVDEHYPYDLRRLNATV